MTVYVFTGPTLSPQEGRVELDAIYLPPAAEGDVYGAACQNPRAIGIIDGYFEFVPAVWHKEILWAMAQGIHVFGSASMGALRAAELAPFGMEGVGRIFEAYRDGILEDDDEVAVAHAPAAQGFRPSSVAMVDIRATLAVGASAGVITGTTQAGLERIGKSIFYQERTYERVLECATENGFPVNELNALQGWLPHGQVRQKCADALAMLSVMREQLAATPGPKQIRYWFEYTDAWDNARRQAEKLPLDRWSP